MIVRSGSPVWAMAERARRPSETFDAFFDWTLEKVRALHDAWEDEALAAGRAAFAVQAVFQAKQRSGGDRRKHGRRRRDDRSLSRL